MVAIASRRLARAEAQARELGVERAHGSYEALLADAEVDAVYISLPNELHHEWTLRALAAGKHVLCEKPYSRSPEDVEEAFAAAEATGLVLAEAAHVAPPPAGSEAGQARRERGDRRTCASCAPRSASCSTTRRDTRLLEEPAGGGLMDVGCSA